MAGYSGTPLVKKLGIKAENDIRDIGLGFGLVDNKVSPWTIRGPGFVSSAGSRIDKRKHHDRIERDLAAAAAPGWPASG